MFVYSFEYFSLAKVPRVLAQILDLVELSCNTCCLLWKCIVLSRSQTRTEASAGESQQLPATSRCNLNCKTRSIRFLWVMRASTDVNHASHSLTCTAASSAIRKKDKVYTKTCQIHLSLWSLLTQSHSVILWEWCWMVTWLWLPPLLQASGRPQPFAGFSALSDPIPRHRVGFQPPGSLEHCNKCCSHVYQALLAFLPLWWSAINTVPFHPASPWHLLWVPWCLRGVVAHQIPQLSCAVHPQDASSTPLAGRQTKHGQSEHSVSLLILPCYIG